MAASPKTGIGERFRNNAWVILADVAGISLLVAVLLSAGGSPALKEWMFMLLTAIPALAAMNIMISHLKPQPAPVPVKARVVAQRRIIIAPRPIDQRAR
jgi:hypothetical protein